MTVPGAPPAAEGTSWDRQLVCVAGLGVSGPPAARALAARGAQVVVLDSGDDEARRARAAELARLGIKVLLGSTADDAGLPPGTRLVVTSPGWRPDAPLLAAAARAGVPVIGDVELAWRLRPVLADGTAQAWLGVTGTNGKTTTVKMLAAMLAVGGAARCRGRERRHLGGGGGHRGLPLPGARGRAVQLPAALEQLAAPAGGDRAQPGRRSHRLARRPGVLRA